MKYLVLDPEVWPATEEDYEDIATVLEGLKRP